ncbi:MAG TPA: oligosaccharide flippase family protein [Bacteroidales bacterium]|nr:oligosaccharide flippase family protein [Bacteroidales bacterium]
MLSKVRTIGTNTMYYGLGNILNKSLGFILIPIYARVIPIDQYGILAILELIILLLLALLTFGITSGHERFFFLEREKNEYNTFLFNNVLWLFLLSLFSLGIISLFRSQLSVLFWGNSSHSYLILLIAIITFIEINNIIPFQILQYEGKPVAYITTNFIRLLVSVLATIYFVLIQKLGIEGVLYGRLFGSGLIMLFQFVAVVFPRIMVRFDLSKVKMTMQYGLPLTVSLIGYLIFASSDRYMINWLLDESQTGMYGFGYKISNVIMLIVQSIGIGYLPSMYKEEKQADNVRFYRKMLFYYTLIMGYALLGFLFFYKVLLWPLVQNKEYWNGLQIVPVMSLAFLIMGMNYFVNIGLTLKNKTRYYIIPTFISAVVNIGLNFVFIKQFGFIGAAYSALISQTLNTVLIGVIANRFMPIGFEWKKIFTVLILVLIFFIIGMSVDNDHKFLLGTVRVILLAIFPLILYKLNLFEAIEIQRTKEGIIKLKNRISEYKKR